jgi:hypothetical protein
VQLTTKTIRRAAIQFGRLPAWLDSSLTQVFGVQRGSSVESARLQFPTANSWISRWGVLPLPAELAFACWVQERLEAWSWDEQTVGEFAAVAGCRYLVEDGGLYDGVLHRLVTLYAPDSIRGIAPPADAGPPWICAAAQQRAPSWFLAAVNRPAASLREALADRYPSLFPEEAELASYFGPNDQGRLGDWRWHGLSHYQQPVVLIQRQKDQLGFFQRRDVTAAELAAAKDFASDRGFHAGLVRRPDRSTGNPYRISAVNAIAFTPVPIQ